MGRIGVVVGFGRCCGCGVGIIGEVGWEYGPGFVVGGIRYIVIHYLLV